MAKVKQTLVEIELVTTMCDDVGDGTVHLEVTMEEAERLYKELKDFFDEKSGNTKPREEKIPPVDDEALQRINDILRKINPSDPSDLSPYSPGPLWYGHYPYWPNDETWKFTKVGDTVTFSPTTPKEEK